MPVGETKLRKFRGVNLTDPPTEIGDNEFAWARNCDGREMGYVGPRQVQRIAENLMTPGTGLFDITTRIDWIPWDTGVNDGAFDSGLYQFHDANGAHRIVAYIPGEWPAAAGADFRQYDPFGVFLHTGQSGFYFPDSDASIVWKPGSSFSNASGRYFRRERGVPSRPCSLVYNNELYLFLGHSYPGLILGADDIVPGVGPKFRQLGTGWQNTFDVGNPPVPTQLGFTPAFAFGDVYRGSFVMGGLGPPYESLLGFTNIDETPEVLLDVRKWAAFGFGDGDKLLNYKTVPVTGGSVAVEPYGLAFKQRSVWMMQGDVPSSTDEGTLVITPVMRGEGLVSPHAVCTTPMGLFWCSGKNVWWMPPGQAPLPIGQKISGFLKTLPQTPTSAWFIEYHDEKLYLNFPWAAGMVDGKTYGGSERKYLPSGQLWCDLRKLKEGDEEDPAGPRWWGPQDVRCSHMLSLNFPDGANALAGLAPWWESTNYIIQPFTMADSGIDAQDGTTGAVTARGYDLADPGDTGGVGTVGDPDRPVASTWQVLRTREMEFGDGDLEKIIDGVCLNAKWTIALGSALGPAIGADYPLLLLWYANGGRKRSQPQNPVAETEDHSETSEQSPGFILDENSLDSAVTLSETYIPLKYWPAQGARFLARSFQLIVQSTQVVDSATPGDDDFRTRLIMLRSITLTARPIARRPGGSYGG